MYNKGNFEAKLGLSEDAKSELHWWINHIEKAYDVISHGEPNLTITTNASKTGWGAVCGHVSTGGHWSHMEANKHINILVLVAAYLGMQTFAKCKTNSHVRIKIDNTTAVSVINRMGTSHSIVCNVIGKNIWEWCVNRNIWVSAAHIPGKCNSIADSESRKGHREFEWMLNTKLSIRCIEHLEFQTEINHQFPKYLSYRPDPHGIAVDAFTIPWAKLNFYAFPPFSVIPMVLNKIRTEQATGIVVLPNWPTQPWYPIAIGMLKQDPIHLKPSKDLLHLPSLPGKLHPLSNKLNLMVCLLSGENWMQPSYQLLPKT